jgi:hypothetical protein
MGVRLGSSVGVSLGRGVSVKVAVGEGDRGVAVSVGAGRGEVVGVDAASTVGGTGAEVGAEDLTGKLQEELINPQANSK